ncbi:MAG: hypothetical protein A3J74_08115, partial [Elusimicrobia bacterium RIFCSPHIGHO2_02_FULL_57_9]
RGGERVEAVFSQAQWDYGQDFESWVLHEDKQLLVLAKPAGLLMHPLGNSWLESAEAALREPQPNLAGLLQRVRPELLKGGISRCGIVHRLDRQTSGVLLIAKTASAQQALMDDFKFRRMRKLYRAIVRGVPADKSPRVDAPIGRKPGHRRVIVTPFGKPAETAFKVVATGKNAALVEARPVTGRTHQIRAHLALLGHPVMGDVEFDRKTEGQPWPSRLMLHAYKVELAHPGTSKPVSFTAELPKDFKDFWARCRKKAG